jgi:hypothetical protein
VVVLEETIVGVYTEMILWYQMVSLEEPSRHRCAESTTWLYRRTEAIHPDSV